MGGDPFRAFAARRYTTDDLALLTDEEEQILLGRRRASPQEMAIRMHMSVESVHRRQKSILRKLG
jgi:DNA-binding CsgD family transcriptional regulator